MSCCEQSTDGGGSAPAAASCEVVMSAPAAAVDASVAINAAILALVAAFGGGTICLGPGTYNVFAGSTINLASNIVIKGAGWATIINGLALAAGTTPIIDGNGVTGAAVRDLQIRGNQVGEVLGTQIGIRLRVSSTRCQIRNVLFSGPDATHGLNVQVQLANSDRNEVRNCSFDRIIGTSSGFGYDVLVETSNDNEIADNVSVQTATQGRHHIYLSAGSSRNIVRGNNCNLGTSDQITLFATEAQAACQHNIIAENVCRDMTTATASLAAIHITQKCFENEVVGNIVLDSDQFGIRIEASGVVAESHADRNIVRGNAVLRSGTNGIRIDGASQCQIVGNYVYESSQNGVASFSGIDVRSNGVNAPANDNVIQGNTSLGTTNQRGPIRIDSGAPAPARTAILGNAAPFGNFMGVEDGGADTLFGAAGDVNRDGTNLVAGNFALSAGWGATATRVVPTFTSDMRGQVTVTANGAGIAVGPTVTLTFVDGAFPHAPRATVVRNDANGPVPVPVTWTTTTTTLVITFGSLPIAGTSYIFDFQIEA